VKFCRTGWEKRSFLLEESSSLFTASIAGDFSSYWAVLIPLLEIILFERTQNLLFASARFQLLSSVVILEGLSKANLVSLCRPRFHNNSALQNIFYFSHSKLLLLVAENANPAPRRLIGEKRHPIPGPPNNCYLRITLSK
jgi:hypothetical protein